MPDFTLPRAERLRSLKAIRRMFGEGKGGFVYPFRYAFYVEPCDAESGCTQSRGIEVMFSVPKKFHKRANKRNILKRRTREAYRLSAVRDALRSTAEQQGVNIDLALIYSTKESHSYKTINNAVQRILEQVRTGL
ncbi:MAG: ribonuclease P protein component [Alistipes sp.]|nr:ribonuclease P protein component [Alistipes sp.]